MKLIETVDHKSPYFIAEMSANHCGNLDMALAIVHEAKRAGADCLKIQTYTADTMTLDCDNEFFRIKGGLWDGYRLYDLYKEAATPWEWQKTLKDECDTVGIDFMSTPFDAGSADFLESLGVQAYKIASFELVDIPLIRHVAQKGKPMIVSCGMGSFDEILLAVETMLEAGLGRERIFLLKCVSEYPADPADMNLATIADMASRFGVRAGLSDHSMGPLAAVVAVSIGACIVEKHFCLNRRFRNPDSAFSMEPAEFAQMVAMVKEGQILRGEVSYTLTEKERSSLVFRRSLFAAKDIDKGEMFTEENLRSIRPGYGLAPKYYDGLLNSMAERDYQRGEPIQDSLPTN
ncbi:MAG: pseudaminic acid synthase [Peptococcaceae bacterium]|nr:pseudaminic acid synthase [Peptococcaceae bacterium]